MKRKIRAKLPYPLNIQDPALLFDMICFDNFIKGDFGVKADIDKNRKVYEEIKRLILYYEEPISQPTEEQ